LERLREEIRKLQECLREERRQNEEAREETQRLKNQLQQTREETQRLRREAEEVRQDKQEILSLIDKKEHALEIAQNEIKTLQARYEELNKTHSNTLAQLNERDAQLLSITFEKTRLEQECDTLQQQLKWQETQLNITTQELLELRKSKVELLFSFCSNSMCVCIELMYSPLLIRPQASEVFELQQRVNELNETLKHEQNIVKDLKQKLNATEARVSELLQQIENLQREHMQSEQQLQNELASAKKLSSLYQNKAEDAVQKIEELQRVVHSLSRRLEDNKRSSEQTLQRARDEIEALRSELSQRERDIETLKQQLEEARSGTRHSTSNVSTLTPTQLVERVQQLLTSSSSSSSSPSDTQRLQLIIELEHKYEVATQQLQAERMETRRLTNYLNEILHEIETKAPQLEAQKRAWEKSIKEHAQLTQALEQALRTNTQLEIEVQVLRRERDQLIQENADLSKQVQVLLTEAEVQRRETNNTSLLSTLPYTTNVTNETDNLPHPATGDHTRADTHDPREDTETATTITTTTTTTLADRVISQHLVTFRNVQELHTRNLQLLRLVRELSRESERTEEGEPQQQQQLTTRQSTDTLLQKALSELKSLKRTYEEQETKVKTLIEQRDMYRTLYMHSEARLKQITEQVNPPSSSSPPSTSTLPSVIISSPSEWEREREHLTVKLKETETNLSLQTQQVTQLQTENIRLTTALAHAQAQLEWYKQREQQQRDTQAETVRALQARIEGLLQLLAKHEQSEVERATHIEELVRTRDKLSLQVQSLQTQLRLLTEQLNKQHADLRTAQQQLNNTTLLHSQLSAVQETRIKDLTQSVTEFQHRISELTTTLTTKEEVLRDLRKNLEECESRLNAERARRESEESKVHQLREELLTLQHRLENMTREKESLTQQLNELRIQLTTLQREREGTTTGAVEAQLRLELAQCCTERDTLREEIKALQEHIAHLKTITQTQTESITELTTNLRAREEELNAERTERTKLTQTIRDLKDQLLGAEQTHQEALASLQSQYNTLTTQHLALSQKCELLQQQLSDLTTQRDLLRGMTDLSQPSEQMCVCVC
jgi:chromosome segregation ATPase